MMNGVSIIQGKLTWKMKNQFAYAHLRPDSETKGSETVNFSINSFTEFDPLQCVIVGYVDSTATSPLEILEVVLDQKFESNKFSPEMINKDQQDLNNLSVELTQQGVEVLRVGKKDWSKKFEVNGVKVKGYNCHSPRDIPFIYHNSLYEFPTFFVNRLQEYQVFEWIEEQLHKKGSQIYSPWKCIRKPEPYQEDLKNKIYKSESEYFGDAANLLKVGLDIIFLISQSGSKGCYRVFRKFMEDKYQGKVRVHPLENSYEGIHIDTSISFIGYNKKLGKYLALVDGLEATDPAKIPAILRGKNWRLIQINKYNSEYNHPQYDFMSGHIGLNFLMINPELAVLSENQVEIKKVLQFYGIKAVPVQLKHICQFAGSIHCTTNDVSRVDTHGFGKVLSTPKQNLTKAQLSGLFDPELLAFLEQKGDIQDWTQICNQNGIFPEYCYAHLTEEEKSSQIQKHFNVKQKYPNHR